MLAAFSLRSFSFVLPRFGVIVRRPSDLGFKGVVPNEQSKCALMNGTQGHAPGQRILHSEHTSLYPQVSHCKTLTGPCDASSQWLAMWRQTEIAKKATVESARSSSTKKISGTVIWKFTRRLKSSKTEKLVQPAEPRPTNQASLYRFKSACAGLATVHGISDGTQGSSALSNCLEEP